MAFVNDGQKFPRPMSAEKQPHHPNEQWLENSLDQRQPNKKN